MRSLAAALSLMLYYAVHIRARAHAQHNIEQVTVRDRVFAMYDDDDDSKKTHLFAG